MTKIWVAVIAGASGVALGLLIADVYAKATVKNDIDSGLSKIGLGGGAVQGFVDQFVVPQVVS